MAKPYIGMLFISLGIIVCGISFWEHSYAGGLGIFVVTFVVGAFLLLDMSPLDPGLRPVVSGVSALLMLIFFMGSPSMDGERTDTLSDINGALLTLQLGRGHTPALISDDPLAKSTVMACEAQSYVDEGNSLVQSMPSAALLNALSPSRDDGKSDECFKRFVALADAYPTFADVLKKHRTWLHDHHFL